MLAVSDLELRLEAYTNMLREEASLLAKAATGSAEEYSVVATKRADKSPYQWELWGRSTGNRLAILYPVTREIAAIYGKPEAEQRNFFRSLLAEALEENRSTLDTQRSARTVAHAVAQQELEGLKVSQATFDDMQRAAKGEISTNEVIDNIYARFEDVPIFR
jgi:hypothetical protein